MRSIVYVVHLTSKNTAGFEIASQLRERWQWKFYCQYVFDFWLF